ncbi:leucine-rich repeats and immunoglobulin-like domains protein 1 isoform X1 [Pseudonaja textilis]|uniref:leucine-rich repeats and immunoglobulin-like domains protein 1 isoform X1 n=1 Tax=Pseudonaja textilis TaxID=8673 RepID=UPI000EA94179|nr:leucine-rich repeats and immunoglobulin-like domains protein 1 isoform X1 [Pseudonaja textilis]
MLLWSPFFPQGYKMALPGWGEVRSSPLRGACFWTLLLIFQMFVGRGSCVECDSNCTCTGDLLDCSNRGLERVPLELPPWIVHLNLSHNKLTEIDPSAFAKLPKLREVRLNNNELTAIPSLGAASAHITSLFLNRNRIHSIEASQLEPYVSLETLDLSSNNITEIQSGCFPVGLPIKDLYLGSNRISVLDTKAFNSLSRSLLTLRLNKNRIVQLPVKAFKLPHLTQLELNRNRIRLIEGLTFYGLDSLEVLKLQRNNISKLTDGAFWGLAKMEVLHLEHNVLTEVNGGSLFGLLSLQQFHLSNNLISSISPAGWNFCQKLNELSLSFNNLTRLDKGSLADLGSLEILHLSHNSISHIAEGVFKGLKSLHVLNLDHNEISGTIEDTSGAFTGLENLSMLTLFGNKIKSVAKEAFSGLEALEHLNLGNNAIRSIQEDAFAKLKNLKELRINSESFLCDCQLKWLPLWLTKKKQQLFVEATCAHPESLKGKNILEVVPESFVCDDFPKPKIIIEPETTITVLGKDIRLTCSAASSSSSPMTFAWKKDNEILHHAEMENFAHVRARDGVVIEYTTILHLRRVTFSHEGRYQCIITNHFGSTYSQKAQLIVNVLPSFLKTPYDVAARTGTTARLECAARGHPLPQIAWQKDGGTDFPAARERRMHVMPDDDVFFITDVKIDDMGVYSCTAQNSAGSVSANATLTVLETPSLVHPLEDRVVSVGETVVLQCKATGSPPPRINWLKGDHSLTVTERHHFTPGNQLLIVRNVVLEDAGKYTCEISNTVGTERAHSQVSVLPSLGCRKDGTTFGIMTIAVVCSIVLTSLVWVCIIYQTRKKSEEYSVTNTDETIVPPDVPSCLSSQGTLSDRQESVENSQQPNGQIQSNGICQLSRRRDVEGDAPSVIYRQPKICLGYNKESWKGEDIPDRMLLTDKTAYSLPAAYTDCDGSVDIKNVYPKSPDYYSLAAEAMTPNTPSSKDSDKHDGILTTNCSSPLKCSTNTDSRRSDVSGTIYPSNHDRMSTACPSKLPLEDSKGLSQPLANCEPYDCLLPAEGSLLHRKGSAELSEALPGGEVQPWLVSSGHLTRSPTSLPQSSH